MTIETSPKPTECSCTASALFQMLSERLSFLKIIDPVCEIFLHAALATSSEDIPTLPDQPMIVAAVAKTKILENTMKYDAA